MGLRWRGRRRSVYLSLSTAPKHARQTVRTITSTNWPQLVIRRGECKKRCNRCLVAPRSWFVFRDLQLERSALTINGCAFFAGDSAVPRLQCVVDERDGLRRNALPPRVHVSHHSSSPDVHGLGRTGKPLILGATYSNAFRMMLTYAAEQVSRWFLEPHIAMPSVRCSRTRVLMKCLQSIG